MWNGGKVRGTTPETYLSLFGTIPEFSQKLATMRKYEISCTIIIQALSQIKALYKDDWEVLIGNCDSLLFLGGSDQTTLKYISERLGKETIRSQNNSRSYGKQGSYSLSFNKTGRELLTADEIAVMDNNNCILFIRGQYPFFTVKYNYPRHPNYHMTGDANDKNQFNPKTITTGKLVRHTNENAEKAKMIERQAAKANLMQSERERKLNARKVEKTGSDGTALHEPLPTREFVEKICETSTPCEMAKSMVLSESHTDLNARQYETLRQYCSEKEIEKTFAKQNFNNSNEIKTQNTVTHTPEMNSVSQEKNKLSTDVFIPEEDTSWNQFFLPEGNEEFYTDTYQEIYFDDAVEEPDYISASVTAEDASELGELMQRAKQSVKDSDKEGS